MLQILIGPSDWSDYATGKIGIERCQVQNLPDFNLGPGVYELGVTAPSWVPTLHSKRPRSLRREDVIAVYVGQAVNIRQRLHKYGQTGAHLEGSRYGFLFVIHGTAAAAAKLLTHPMNLTEECRSGFSKSVVCCCRSFATSCQGDDGSVSGGSSTPRTWNGGGDAAKVAAEIGPRLFSEAFALGSSIAFRWAHVSSRVRSSHSVLLFNIVINKLISVFSPSSCKRDLLGPMSRE